MWREGVVSSGHYAGPSLSFATEVLGPLTPKSADQLTDINILASIVHENRRLKPDLPLVTWLFFYFFM